MTVASSWIAWGLAAALGGTALPAARASPAQQLFVYPQRGQASEQQSRDRYDWHQWAEDTGAMSASVVEADGAFVISGSCTTP